MKIPNKGRFAVAAMIDLAIHDPRGPLTIAQIAENQRISLSYLEQLFADLRKHRLVRGTRGPGGGYRLNGAPADINLAQILRAVDDNVFEESPIDEPYAPYRVWANLSQMLNDYLASITLEDCANNPAVAENLTTTEHSPAPTQIKEAVV